MNQDKLLTQQIASIFFQHGTLKHFNAGQVLVEKGQPATQSCYVVRGQVRTFCMNPEGDIVTLFYVEENNLICSESLLLDSLVNVSVQAITPVDMYVMPGKEFLRLWEEHGYMIHKLFRPLITRLTLLSDYICCTHFRENDKKVAYFLYSCYNRSGAVVCYSNEQIGDIIGINRVSVNRILNNFAKKGILELEYKKITILDAQRLSKVFNDVGYFID